MDFEPSAHAREWLARLQAFMDRFVLPYNRLPRAALTWDQPFGRWFTAGIDAEAVRFQDPVKSGGSRVDLLLRVKSWKDVISFFKPVLNIDAFHASNTP